MFIYNMMLIKSTSSTPDTPAAFAGNSAYDQAALNAATPAGYNEVFRNLDAAAVSTLIWRIDTSLLIRHQDYLLLLGLCHIDLILP